MRHFVLAAALTIVFTSPAYAYLDPGTGSIILQGIVGALAIGAAYVSIFWSRVKNFFSVSIRSKKKSTAVGAEHDR